MLDDIVTQYIRQYPHEAAGLALLIDQLETQQKLNDRRNFNGHVTGSGIVLSADQTKILLIHHKGFNRWQQPGGHWESDDESDPLVVAEREVAEETGVRDLEYLPMDPAHPLVPVDIDTHEVPARPHKDEPDHWHHDFRYVFITTEQELTHQEAEVNAAGWFDLNAPESFIIRTVIDKLRQLKFIK